MGTFEMDFREIRDRWSVGGLETPKAFMLVGRGGPDVLDGEAGRGALVVDAEGVTLRSGATYAWCRNGCCEQPRYWPSVEAAADFHGSYIVCGDGTVRAPGAVVPDNGSEVR